MKRKNIYFLSIAVFIAAVIFIFLRHQAKEKNKEEKVYYLLERTGNIAQLQEWKEVQKQANMLLQKLRNNPADEKSMVALAGLYIREARTTGNYMYYDRAAMKYVNEVLKQNPVHFEALSLKAMIFISEHHFAEGLATAQQAVAINPYNAFIYGILVDGFVEMGNYKAAVENMDKMISIRPDLRSYSRIAYLREIHGDYAGAIEAMKLAVDAGAPGDETTAWTRVQLGSLYEKTGDIENAKMNYNITLNERPGYAYALVGLGRIAVVQKKYNEAIAFYQQADTLIQDYSMKDELSEVYLLDGQLPKANAIASDIIANMVRAAENEKQEDSIGHYSDRELAYAYLKINETNKALDHALAEYNRRPDNIDVNETVAWVYYTRGEYAKALPYLKTAMKTNSRNPTLLCRAGLIYSKAGDVTMAKNLLQDVLTSNANISYHLKSEGIKILQTR